MICSGRRLVRIRDRYKSRYRCRRRCWARRRRGCMCRRRRSSCCGRGRSRRCVCNMHHNRRRCDRFRRIDRRQRRFQLCHGGRLLSGIAAFRAFPGAIVFSRHHNDCNDYACKRNQDQPCDCCDKSDGCTFFFLCAVILNSLLHGSSSLGKIILEQHDRLLMPIS